MLSKSHNTASRVRRKKATENRVVYLLTEKPSGCDTYVVSPVWPRLARLDCLAPGTFFFIANSEINVESADVFPINKYTAVMEKDIDILKDKYTLLYASMKAGHGGVYVNLPGEPATSSVELSYDNLVGVINNPKEFGIPLAEHLPFLM